jgi:hypothetical protein
MAVADTLEIRGIEIYGAEFSGVPLCNWCEKAPEYLSSIFLCRQVWSSELQDGLDLSVLECVHLVIRGPKHRVLQPLCSVTLACLMARKDINKTDDGRNNHSNKKGIEADAPPPRLRFGFRFIH